MYYAEPKGGVSKPIQFITSAIGRADKGGGLVNLQWLMNKAVLDEGDRRRRNKGVSKPMQFILSAIGYSQNGSLQNLLETIGTIRTWIIITPT